MIKSRLTPRVATRGEQIKFRVAFFQDQNQTVPIVPLDPNLYPAYKIIDINGGIIQDGVGVPDTSAGFWKADFYVPTDAILSVDQKRWRIEWLMLYAKNRQMDFVEEFDIRDVAVTESHHRDIEFIALENRPFRTMIRQTVIPNSLRLDVKNANTETEVIVNNKTYPTDIQMAEDGDSYVFYYDIPENLILGNNKYLALWETRETVTSQSNFEFQKICGVPWKALQWFPSVRLLIDRFQIKLGQPQAYEDSDIYEGLWQGAQIVNTWHPYTRWDFLNFPPPMEHFLIMAAGIWLLQSQKILENYLSFDFSGQTISLNYNHAADIDSSIGSFMDYFRQSVTPAKTAVVRASTPTGTVAGRPYRYSALHNFVYPMQTVSSSDFLGLLSKIGLL